MKKEKNEQEAKEDAGEGPEYVHVKCNLDVWTIDYPGRGQVSVFEGQEAKFNVHEPQELHALLQAIKEMNRPSTNQRAKVKKEPDGRTMTVYVNRLEFGEGKDLLPKVLQDMRYTGSGMFTNDEMNAIKSLCPGYRFQRDRPRASAGG